MLDPLARDAHICIRPRIARLAPLLLLATQAHAQFGAQPVGITSDPEQIHVKATAAGFVTRLEILTLGSPHGDFTAAAGPSTCTAAILAIVATCTERVVFTPAASGLRMGAVVLVGTLNGADSILGVTYLSGNGTAESFSPVPGQTDSTAIDGAGNTYIADTDHNRILMICGTAATTVIHKTTCSTAGDVSTIAGDGTTARIDDGNHAITAPLNHPTSVAIDGAGNLLIADSGNNLIREINSLTGTISTIAGNTEETICSSAIDSIGDGCPATEAILNRPQSIAVDGRGNLIITDTGNNATRYLDRATGTISTLTVAGTTTAITSSLDPSGFGQSVTFTVTVSSAPNTGDLNGTVSIADTYGSATATLASGLPLDSSSEATISISALAVGQHSIVASYHNANDPVRESSASSPLIETVLEGTAVSLTSSVNPATIGQSITFTAAVSSLGGGIAPTGTLTFYDGSAVLSTPTLDANGTASYTTSSLSNGPHHIVAVYSGNPSAEVEGSTSPAIYEDVQSPSSISISSSLNPSTYGIPVIFTAAITSSATSPATGTVNFLDNGATIGAGTLSGNPATATLVPSILSAGTHRITAVYAGDSKNQASNSNASPLNQSVQQAQTVTALSATPTSGAAGSPETFTAAVELSQGSAPITGVVSFTSGNTPLGSAALNASGVASISPKLAAGEYQIVATYEGDANAITSASNVPACSVSSPTLCSNAGPLLYTVAAASTQTALSVSPTTTLAANPIAFTATVAAAGLAPTGSVNFLANGVVIGTAPLDGTTATFIDSSLPAGNYILTAEYLGDMNHAISASASVAETVNAIPTTTSLTAATTTGNNPQVALTATVTSNGGNLAPSGTVKFMNGATALGEASFGTNGIATLAPTLLSGANYTIDAVYSGDSYHSSSTSQIVSVAGVASGFSLTVAPSFATVSSARSATFTVTVNSLATFDDTITFSCASLPATFNCRFSSAVLNLPAGRTAATQLTLAANSAQSTQASATRRVKDVGSMYVAGLLLPLGFGWFSRRQRRSNTRLLSAAPLLIFAVIAIAATGCGAVLQPATSSGNYVIQVTATGATTNVVRTQSINLNLAR